MGFGGADAVARWLAGGVSPLPHVTYETSCCGGGGVRVDGEPLGDLRHPGAEFGNALPDGEEPPGWCW